MTGSTANSSGLGLFETPFSIGATAISAIGFLASIVFAVMGYQKATIPLAGELSILTGMVGLLFGLLIGIVAFVAAAYMEPGFDH